MVLIKQPGSSQAGHAENVVDAHVENPGGHLDLLEIARLSHEAQDFRCEHITEGLHVVTGKGRRNPGIHGNKLGCYTPQPDDPCHQA